MTSFTEPRRAGLPKWIKVALVLGVVVGLIALVLYALGVAATTRWERYAAELRAKGEPLTFEEIEAMRTRIPDEENGALVIEKLKPALERVSPPPNTKNILVFTFVSGDDDLFSGFPSAAIAPSQTFVDQHSEVLGALSKLRAFPAGRFDIDLSVAAKAPWDIVLPQLTHLRTASKLVYLDALMKTLRGDVEGALGSVEIQGALSGTVSEHPTVIARLVQIANESQIPRTAEVALRAGSATPMGLTHAQKIVVARLEAGSVIWAFRGERAFFSAICENLASGRVSLQDIAGTGGLPGASWLPAWLVRRNQIEGVTLISSLVEAGDDPLALAAAVKRMDEAVAQTGPTRLLVKIFLPSLSRAVTLNQKNTASLLCTHAALAAERFRLEKSRLPESLEELVPEFLDAVPTDPFDGNPLRFRTTEQGIVIYSIDENLIDDGGSLEPQKKRPRRSLDVGFRLLKPEHRRLILLDEPADAEEESQP